MSQIFYLGPTFIFMKSRKIVLVNLPKVTLLSVINIPLYSYNYHEGNCVSDFYFRFPPAGDGGEVWPRSMATHTVCIWSPGHSHV